MGSSNLQRAQVDPGRAQFALFEDEAAGATDEGGCVVYEVAAPSPAAHPPSCELPAAERLEIDADDATSIELWLSAPAYAFTLWKRTQLVRGKAEFGEHSIEQYACMWSRWCAFMARRGLDVATVAARDVDDFLSGLRGGRLHDRPAAPATRRRYLFLVARTFAFLESLGILASSPCEGMAETQRHRASERPARALLSQQQEARFVEWTLQEAEGPRWERARDCALRLLFLASGITVAEARALCIGDVHVEPRPVQGEAQAGTRLVATLDLAAHGLVPARRAPVADFAVAPLAYWLLKRRELCAPGERVFNTRRLHDVRDHQALPAAAALSAEEMYELVAIGLRACGYERSRAGPQTLRNAFLARQIRSGVELGRIRDWAGLQTVEQLRALARQVPRRDDGVEPV